MPPYWRTRWRQRRWRRRRWPRYRRPRAPLFWRRRYRRRPLWVRKKHKLKFIKLKQWQPKTIVKCKIKGIKPLFHGSADRLTNNYWQYPTSIVPAGTPGGGGWGLMALSLSSLYEDYEHIGCVFTKSNAGLPLVRIIGAKLTFYQHQYTDYVVEVDNCWPMLDTPLKHANSQPSRMLMGKKKIIVPSIETKPLRKRKKTTWVSPPSQMINKWYFQQEICNTKLLMITASSCSLRNYFLPTRATSNNTTIWALNTNIFKNADFQHYDATTGYKPNSQQWLFTTTGTMATLHTSNMICLANAKDYKLGSPTNNVTYPFPSEHWGNPFHKQYLQQKQILLLSTKGPDNAFWINNPNTQQILQNVQEMHSPILYPMRYNPDRDPGASKTLINKAYFVDNYRTDGDKGFEEPGDPNRIIDGFPLWILLWGYPDWIKKLGQIHNVDKDYILVIKTSFFTEKLPWYVLLDDNFYNGKSYYDTPQTVQDQLNWFPKFYYQQQSVENICKTGPGVCRVSSLLSVQAKMKYSFIVKWGGCPSTMEKIYDPCLQPKWPVPGNLNEGLSIQNPATDPKTQIYEWDVKRDYLTKTAIERLKKDSISIQHPFTGRKCTVPALQTQQEESDETQTSEEEEETTLPIKLLKLRKQQHQLHRQLLRLINTK
ncbi:ORF1 [Anelloviridae sp.]|nr:ORF1 [Anelloviridae sp.]